MLAEREAIEKERELEIAERYEELESELGSLENEGAKDSELKARQKQAEKDVTIIREQYEGALELLQRSFDELTELHTRKTIEYAMLRRELTARSGAASEAGMGATARARPTAPTALDTAENQH